jgi:putative membrane protein
MMYWGPDNGAGWIIMMISMVLFWALLLTLIAFAISSLARHGTQDAPDAILQRRFARGEIDEEEFQARADALHRLRG